MATIDSLEKKLRDTSPEAYLAVSVFAGRYIDQAKGYEKDGRAVIGEVEKLATGHTGEVYSNGVHQAGNWAGTAAGAATTGLVLAGAALVGGLLGGPVGAALTAWLVGGVAGALGGAVKNGVTSAVEAVGAWLAGVFGLDFHRHGTTPGGGTWDSVTHPDGSWERNEFGPDFDVTERRGPDGSFTQDIHGKGGSKGYDSHFRDDGKGNSHFEAVDRAGVFHNSNTDSSGSAWGTANSNDRDANGRGGKHVHTEGRGGSSDIWFYNDGSSSETHRNSSTSGGVSTSTEVTTNKDKDGHTTSQDSKTTTKDDHGNSTTVKTHTDENGKTTSTTESTDANGHPNDPPNPPAGGGSSGRDNPEGNGSEGPPFRPGDFGQGRPGHPFDLITTPGSWRRDDGEWQNEQPPRYRDVVAAMGWAIHTDWYLGHGDAAEETRKEDIRNRVRGAEITVAASGEDFVHPKARAAMLNSMARSVLK